MTAKNAPKKLNEIPWMMGSRLPAVTWITVAIPLHNITDEIRIPICVGFIPMLGPSRSGTETVAPNMVKTCWIASTTARPMGGRSSIP